MIDWRSFSESSNAGCSGEDGIESSSESESEESEDNDSDYVVEASPIAPPDTGGLTGDYFPQPDIFAPW